jgi:xylulokinase
MSLLGIDIGTTGCKSVIFSVYGKQLARSYREYQFIGKEEGYSELDSVDVWNKIQETIREVAVQTTDDIVTALSVSSLGEAMVPVSSEGKILGNSILGVDRRGEEFVQLIENEFGTEAIFRRTGNLPGAFYSMPKIAWIKRFQPELYEQTAYFFTWADFVFFMLGGKAGSNYSLAGRSLLFNVKSNEWDRQLFEYLDLDIKKFPQPVQSGTFLGYVKPNIAEKLSLSKSVSIISGGHDQCCATLGCGITGNSRSAMYGMGTFICVVTAFSDFPDAKTMYNNKMHIEHHVVPGSYVSFIYNQSGGALIKWFRETFYSRGTEHAESLLPDYDNMFGEISDRPDDLLVYPGWGATGPPDFQQGGQGRISGLSFSHSRGDILRAILEGISFYIRECFEKLVFPFKNTDLLVATGGGCVSKIWLQITADVMGKPVIRNSVNEAGSMGAAIIAGVGSSVFKSYDEAVNQMIHKELEIVPDIVKNEFYRKKFELYKNK